MAERTSLMAAEMRASAVQLRAVLHEIDAGTLEASGRERAFIAGALRAVDSVLSEGGTSERNGRSVERV